MALEDKIVIAEVLGSQGMFILCEYYIDIALEFERATDDYILPLLSDPENPVTSNIAELVAQAMDIAEIDEASKAIVMAALEAAIPIVEALVEVPETQDIMPDEYRAIAIAFFDGISGGCHDKMEVKSRMATISIRNQ